MPEVARPLHLSTLVPFSVALALLAGGCMSATAQDTADEEAPAVRHGLVARYTGADGTACTRLDDAIQFVWRGPPDVRISAGPFQATWDGLLHTTAPGRYTLRVFAEGQVSLAVGGQTLLDDTAAEPRWLVASPITLEHGYHPIHVSYASHRRTGQLKLYWEGPRFELESISPRWLFHSPRSTPDDRFERGARLVRALRCAACHPLQPGRAPLRAPALDHLPGNLSRRWLVEWLEETAGDAQKNLGSAAVVPEAAAAASEQETQPAGDRENGDSVVGRRMPHFDLSEPDAEAIAAYLFSKQPSFPDASPPAPKHAADADERIRSGEKLFRTIGCLACHRVGKLGASGLFGGGDLTHVADKRPSDFFARWLTKPESINAHHRMPAYTDTVIRAEERVDLAAYLATLGDAAGQERDADAATSLETSDEKIERGRKLVTRWRCGTCHKLPGENKQTAQAVALSADPDWRQSCLGEVDPESQRPAYALSAELREAIVHYLDAARAATDSENTRIDGRELLREQNCLACHARDHETGLAPVLGVLSEADTGLQALLLGLAPPSLNQVGDKLPDEELRRSIRGREPRLRDWLAVRMPKFSGLGEAELAALVRHFADADRAPELPTPNGADEANPIPRVAEPASDAALRFAGSRLVTSAGFGCTSCHKIGDVAPENVELQSRGTDLSTLGNRVRKPWFDRWVRNPARTMPRIEMPSIQLPVRGVLEGDLDAQLGAVWHVLNEADFQPPRPGPVRVVHASNRPGCEEPATVLTDVLECQGRTFIKPFLVGLPNRHNLLFDLESYRLAAWWIGDTARQHTRGKAWYWEPGGAYVLAPTCGEPELELIDGTGTVYTAQKQGQFVAEFDWFENVPGGVRLASRLVFRSADSGAQIKNVKVVQTFTARRNAAESLKSGWRRRIEVARVPQGFSLRWRPLETRELAESARIDHQQRLLAFHSGGGNCEVRLTAPNDVHFQRQGEDTWLSIPVDSAVGDSVWEVEYRCDLPVDRFFAPNSEPTSASATTLAVVPGFEAQRLGFSRSIMPTGFAWRSDGALVVCSLKGRVWIAHDMDGDGLEDALLQFSNELAAPYGLAVHGDAVDVINKYGLLRLWDRDGDGRADRTELVASGWGHSADYHDWAIGLPRDEEGNYFVALPCQQDDRSPAAGRFRGAAVRLVPRKPTPSEPRLYEIEPFCAGLRFPMGLARNKSGDLFATDNQGNYNPFNELNHLVDGARYGFINKLENRTGFNPPLRGPAIKIPHPWTRSVNGICFLYTPPRIREAQGGDLFGPFEGHLVGCEYDTRRLIRMSLQRVGDTYQGATYPLSLEPDDEKPALLGPVVCQLGPKGNLYVGEMRDSGWGAGANVGAIVRLRPTGNWPPGIAEVRAAADGFIVQFTAPMDRLAAAEKSNYSLVLYRRISTPDYGGPDVDRATVKIDRVELSGDARTARLFVGRLREGFVYELRAGNIGHGGGSLYPAEAHYTLNRVPLD